MAVLFLLCYIGYRQTYLLAKCLFSSNFFSCAVVSGSNMEKLFIIAKPKANGDAILASWWLPEAKQERGISDD
jgi:hypothetical protein